VGATAAPMAKLQDAYIDSKGRLFASNHKEDPTDATVYGTYLTVTDPAGNVLFSGKWGSNLQTYGSVRIFEDGKNRLWLLWSNRGSRSSELLLYPIIETASPLKFTLGAYTDLSKLTFPYALDGTIFMAANRGGNTPGQYVDAIMNACTVPYVSGQLYVNANCYNADGSGLQRIAYMRIHLPD